MLRFLLNISGWCVVIFMGLVMGMRLLGGEKPPDPVLDGFATDCAGRVRGCWYGIEVGTTLFEDGRNRLLQVGFEELQPSGVMLRYRSTGCVVALGYWDGEDIEGQLIRSVQIFGMEQCSMPRLGDLILAAGQVQQVTYSNPFHPISKSFVDGSLNLAGGVNASVLYERHLHNWFSPYSQVAQLGIISMELEGVDWPGFGFRAHFCRIAPMTNVC